MSTRPTAFDSLATFRREPKVPLKPYGIRIARESDDRQHWEEQAALAQAHVREQIRRACWALLENPDLHKVEMDAKNPLMAWERAKCGAISKAGPGVSRIAYVAPPGALLPLRAYLMSTGACFLQNPLDLGDPEQNPVGYLGHWGNVEIWEICDLPCAAFLTYGPEPSLAEGEYHRKSGPGPIGFHTDHGILVRGVEEDLMDGQGRLIVEAKVDLAMWIEDPGKVLRCMWV